MTSIVDVVIAAERRRLVERLRPLDQRDWERPSLCDGWTVRDVVGHLVTPFVVRRRTLLATAARQRSIAGAIDHHARDLGASLGGPALLAVLEANTDTVFRPPGLPPAAPFTDIVAHSADIRWSLGDPHDDWADPARLAPVLDFVTGARARAGFVPPGRLRGLHLVATDQRWERGAGVTLRGPSLPLVMAALGRRAALVDLDGDGVRRLARP